MNEFKRALDKYLTTEPDDGYVDWYEKVDDLVSTAILDAIYGNNSLLLVSNRLYEILFSQGRTPEVASRVVDIIFKHHYSMKELFEQFVAICDDKDCGIIVPNLLPIIEAMIVMTPTGDKRNKLCDLNIVIQDKIKK